MWREHLDSAVDQCFDQMVALRRHLHQFPEVSGQEFDTSLLLYQRLDDAGLNVELGPEGRGVIANLTADSTHRNGSPTAPPATGSGLFALRADIDALCIQDEKSVEYKSRREGVMHACGHDGHAAMVFGATLAMSTLFRNNHVAFRPTLRSIFQPAEETCEGALEMIQHGALEGVDSIIAGHMDPTRPVGTVGLRPGVLTATCDHLQITVCGRGGHAARPHEARDPIAASAQLIQWLYQQIPRVTDSRDSVVVTIGMVQGGNNANVIPDEVILQGTVRTLSEEVRQQTIAHVRRLAEAVERGTSTKIDVSFGVGADAVQNDAQLVSLLETSCRESLGNDAVQIIQSPSMGGEDFAFYCREVPAAMFRLGCASETAGSHGLHTPLFDLDEESLRVGSRLMAHAALSWMESKSPIESG